MSANFTLERKFRSTAWVSTFAPALAQGRSRGLADRSSQLVLLSGRRYDRRTAVNLGMVLLLTGLVAGAVGVAPTKLAGVRQALELMTKRVDAAVPCGVCAVGVDS